MVRQYSSPLIDSARLALGTVQFGLDYGISNAHGQVSEDQARLMIDQARQAGITTLDTAIMYGQSESRLGMVGVDGFDVITKLPEVPHSLVSPPEITSWMEQELESSLQRLKVAKLAGVLLHRPDQILGPQRAGICAALDHLRVSYGIKKIGASIYDPSCLDGLLKQYDFNCIQAPLNVIDQRLVTSGWMHELSARRIEIHTRSAFLQGLLLMDLRDIPEKFSRWKNVFVRWDDWCRETGYSKLTIALLFPLSFPEIDRVVVGASSQRELAQIVEAVTQSGPTDFPDISQTADQLINPANWSNL